MKLLDIFSVAGIWGVAESTSNQAAQFIAAILFYLTIRYLDHWRSNRKKDV